ncbi:MAG TPA: sensor histidine kinase [Vicinamibacterales bacterium]|jgi:signal transduction histidine kinase|nr:sensor histidine kinase [Vicinamibacterales bacterium]
MKRITGRFVLLIATAAVLPLLLYGSVSVSKLTDGTEQSVTRGNQAVAQQIAAQIKLYFDNSHRVLASIAGDLRGTQLEQWQQEEILRNHVLDFPEFREISIFDAGNRLRATSRLGTSTLKIPSAVETQNGTALDYYVAAPYMDADALPTTTMAVPLVGASDEPGWIIAEISLEELWRTVDRIKVGTKGYALLLDEDGNLVAHGNPDDKTLIALRAAAAPEEKTLADNARQPAAPPHAAKFNNPRTGEELLVVVAAIDNPQWTVLVEQPTDDAFALSRDIKVQLFAAIGLALLGTVILGWVWGRSFIQRIFALTRVTRAIADGRMDERVALSGQDEIRQLGDAFNSMADRLVELQEEIRKQERQAMFGRIAAGLVHDLSHPIQNIGNSCKLIQKMFEDAEYRETFKRTVERELVIIKRVLDDLRNIARPIPLERFPVDLNRTVADAAEAMEQHVETAGLTLRTELSPETVYIEGDVFALGRVYRNLILNAIQATAPGGLIVVASEAHGNRVQVRIYDTGCGIPAERLGQIFEDFVTTKRRGLGLGLAISKKIVEQLGGTISVASEVGKGTTFVLDFPRTSARPMLVAG